MIRKLKQTIVGLTMLVVVTLGPATVLVASAQAATNENCTKSSSAFLGFPTWYKYLDFEEGSADCNINFDVKKDVGKVLLAIFEIILRVAGLVAVGFVIYGGIQYVISQGEPDRIKGARTTIINAMIGLAIAISATAIVNLVAKSIT
jgi:hypothetical protein